MWLPQVTRSLSSPTWTRAAFATSAGWPARSAKVRVCDQQVLLPLPRTVTACMFAYAIDLPSNYGSGGLSGRQWVFPQVTSKTVTLPPRTRSLLGFVLLNVAYVLPCATYYFAVLHSSHCRCCFGSSFLHPLSFSACSYIVPSSPCPSSLSTRCRIGAWYERLLCDLPCVAHDPDAAHTAAGLRPHEARRCRGA